MRARLLWQIGAGLLVIAIGFDRWLTGAHFVSDVVGGALFGGLVATAALVVAGVQVPVPHELVTELVRSKAPRRRERDPPRSAAVIFNPAKVTDWVTFRRHVEYELKTRGWHRALWLETTERRPRPGDDRQAVTEKVDLVLGAGGDGTIRVICSGLAGTGIPFGLIPAGTGNLLARNIGIPLDEAARLDVAFDGVDKAIDLVKITVDGETPDHFAVMAGIGIDAVIMQGTEPGPEEGGRLGGLLRLRRPERQAPRAAAHHPGGRRAAAPAPGARDRRRQRRLPAGEHPADPRCQARRRAARRAGRLAPSARGLGPAHHQGADPAEAARRAARPVDREARSRSPSTERDQYQLDGDTVGECQSMDAEVVSQER